MKRELERFKNEINLNNENEDSDLLVTSPKSAISKRVPVDK